MLSEKQKEVFVKIFVGMECCSSCICEDIGFNCPHRYKGYLGDPELSGCKHWDENPTSNFCGDNECVKQITAYFENL